MTASVCSGSGNTPPQAAGRTQQSATVSVPQAGAQDQAASRSGFPRGLSPRLAGWRVPSGLSPAHPDPSSPSRRPASPVDQGHPKGLTGTQVQLISKQGHSLR